MGYSFNYGDARTMLVPVGQVSKATGTFSSSEYAYTVLLPGTVLLHGAFVFADYCYDDNATDENSFPLVALSGYRGGAGYAATGDLNIFGLVCENDSYLGADNASRLVAWIPASSDGTAYVMCNELSRVSELPATYNFENGATNFGRVIPATSSGRVAALQSVIKPASASTKDGVVYGITTMFLVTLLPPDVQTLGTDEIMKYDAVASRLIFGVGATADGSGWGGKTDFVG